MVPGSGCSQIWLFLDPGWSWVGLFLGPGWSWIRIFLGPAVPTSSWSWIWLFLGPAVLGSDCSWVWLVLDPDWSQIWWFVGPAVPGSDCSCIQTGPRLDCSRVQLFPDLIVPGSSCSWTQAGPGSNCSWLCLFLDPALPGYNLPSATYNPAPRFGAPAFTHLVLDLTSPPPQQKIIQGGFSAPPLRVQPLPTPHKTHSGAEPRPGRTGNSADRDWGWWWLRQAPRAGWKGGGKVIKTPPPQTPGTKFSLWQTKNRWFTAQKSSPRLSLGIRVGKEAPGDSRHPGK